MSALERLRAELTGAGRLAPLRVLAASGQLGYGVPEPAFSEGLKRKPHFIGADMGSIDPGPYYLGSGELATSDAMTRDDLRRVLRAARSLDVPLVIGTAGTAGAAPHLARVLEMVRGIARREGLHFRLASIAADMPRDLVKQAVRAGKVRALGAIRDLTERDVDEAAHIVGQMGTEAFRRALGTGGELHGEDRGRDARGRARGAARRLRRSARPRRRSTRRAKCSFSSSARDRGGRSRRPVPGEGRGIMMRRAEWAHRGASALSRRPVIIQKLRTAC